MLSGEAENYENPDKRSNNECQHVDYSPAKRRRHVGDTKHDFTNNHPYNTPSKQLTLEDYTVGWICALHLEMTAARMMLDEEHISPPIPPRDSNSYILGEIYGHNVVITCLPTSIYGNNAAAAVAVNLNLSFKSISVPLLVGIGGGVPRPGHDIRLGDVVVGTAVVQYDFGKTVSNGVFEHRGSLSKPKTSLLNALSSLRSTHQLKGNRIPASIAEVFGRYNLGDTEFEYPGPESDILFETECDHVSEDPVCHECGPLNPIVRAHRQSIGPMVHYGTIASGNQVMKHAKTRDLLAQQHDTLCFEMEAAGSIESLSCLVIRGICDYCDTRKDKRFQGYAALAAAAYAKEFILSLSKSEVLSQVPTPRQSSNEKLQHRQQVMEALNFDEADSRRATVGKVHSQTCKWFLEQQEYRDWADPDKFPEHHGLFWIKGKAGSGKSTLMKFVLEETLSSKPRNCLVISFFFNARGQDLEKSTIGMYRSLVYQLLYQLPELQIVLDELSTSIDFDNLKLQFLRDTFEYILRNLGPRSLVCFVDALDECPEEQIRNMVDFFTDLGRLAVTETISFCVCFSSRYYPNISIDVGQQLDLEKQDGHSQDILQYIKCELKIGKSKSHDALKTEIAERANGIFLWVVLVVQILKQEYDRGMVHKMRERIKMIPQELDKLFRDILTRDNNDLTGLVLCIQWMLYSKRRLNREEFYFALRSGYDNFDGEPWDVEEISTQVMDRFILNCSKGLVELTRGRKPAIQFIHESVSQFLSKPDALLDLWQGFEGLSDGRGHERLKECCYRQISLCNMESLGLERKLPKAKNPDAVKLREAACKSFPFLEYAVHHVMYHAELAKTSHTDFLRKFNPFRWLSLYNLMQRHENHRLPENLALSHILIQFDLPGLLRSFWTPRLLEHDALFKLIKSYIDKKDIRACRTILLAHDLDGRTHDPTRVERIDATLELIKDTLFTHYNKEYSDHIYSVLLDLLMNWHKGINMSYLIKMIYLAARMRRPAALRLALEASALLDQIPLERSRIESSVLFSIVKQPSLGLRHYTNSSLTRNTILPSLDLPSRDTKFMSETISCMSLLLARGISFDSYERGKRSSLVEVSKWADASVLQFLLDNGAHLFPGEEPLCLAVEYDNVHAIRFWVGRAISIDTQNNEGDIVLSDADIQRIAKILIDHGAANNKDKEGRTLLHTVATETWDESAQIINLVSSQLVNLNDTDNRGKTALHLAAENQAADAKMVSALLDNGANLESVDNCGNTPLHLAAYGSTPKIVKTLLDHEAAFDCINNQGSTPLHLAVIKGETEVIDALLHSGANANCVDNQGQTPLHHLHHDRNCTKAERLIHGGAQINLRDERGRTPIQFISTFYHQESLIETLFNHGAEIDIPSEFDGDYDYVGRDRMVKTFSKLELSKRSKWCCHLDPSYPSRHSIRFLTTSE